MLPIWKAAAPAIDILAPDDYQGDPAAYVKVLELYRRDDNPLFLPESGCFQCDPASGDFTRYFFTILGLQAIGDSESRHEPAPYLARNFVLVGPMQREIARLNFEGQAQGRGRTAALQGRRPGRSQAEAAVRILERSGDVRNSPVMVPPTRVESEAGGARSGCPTQ